MSFLSNSVYVNRPTVMASIGDMENMTDLENFKDDSNIPFVPLQDLTKDPLQTLCDIVGINSYHPLNLSDLETEIKIKEETIDVPKLEATFNPRTFDCDSTDIKVCVYAINIVYKS